MLQLDQKPWRPALTMGNQLSETHENYTGKSSQSRDHPLVDQALQDHFTNGATKVCTCYFFSQACDHPDIPTSPHPISCCTIQRFACSGNDMKAAQWFFFSFCTSFLLIELKIY